jgi:L-iditol 2-dehydrogenase
LGHEVTGEVVEVGVGVTQLKINDQVGVMPDVYCGRCSQCRNGFENLCVNVKSLGYSLDGAYSEYLKLPKAFLERDLIYKIPSAVSMEEAALTEPLACCFHGLTRSKVGVGKTTLIVGDGPIGLMHLMLAKLMGGRVGMSGLIDRNLDLARSLGADFVINASKEKTRDRVLAETANQGADIVIVAVSSPPVVEQAIHFASKNSVVVVFGGCPPHSTMTIDPNIIHYDEVNLTGSSGYTYDDYRKTIRIIADKRVRPEKLITHSYPLSEIREAFDADIKGEAIKVMIRQ